MSEFFELHYTGFHCIRQSTLDFTPWDDDEPYFLFTVTDGLDTSDPKRSQVYEKVRSGTTRRQPGEFPVWRTTDPSAERHTISLIATAFEKDWGNKSEAETAFKNVVSAAIRALEEEFTVVLFDRPSGSRTVRPTAAAMTRDEASSRATDDRRKSVWGHCRP